MSTAASLRQWIKSRDGVIADTLYRTAMALRYASMPVIPGVHSLLYHLHETVGAMLSAALRVLWYTPLFQSRLERPAPNLHLHGGIPLILGRVRIRLGDLVRFSGQTTISGRVAGFTTPTLSVGDNVDIGWQTTIAVGRSIVIGNNVRIAGRTYLCGYPGHPLDPSARASGAPDTEDQVDDIVLDDDVWLATGVTVMPGVRIGRGTVVAAGSVVTDDLPAFVLAGGAPAIVIRPISSDDSAFAGDDTSAPRPA